MVSADRRVERLEKIKSDSKNKLEMWRNRRLLCGLGLFVGFILISFFRSSLIPPLIVAGSVVGLFGMVVITRRIEAFIERLSAWGEYMARQKMRQSGRGPSKLAVSSAPLSHQVEATDLHLLGPNSVLGLIDESLTDGGQSLMLQTLFQGLSSKAEVAKVQEATRMIARNRWPLEKVIVQSLKSSNEPIRAQALSESLNIPAVNEGFRGAKFFGYLAYVLAWGLFFFAVYGGAPFSPYLPLAVYFFLSLYLMGYTAEAFNKAQDYSQSAKALRALFSALEGFSRTPLGPKFLPRVIKAAPSKKLGKLEKCLAKLSYRANPLFYFLINLLFPWDLFYSARLEAWRKSFSSELPPLLDELYSFELLQSGALFYNYQSQSLPSINEAERPTLKFKKLFHPLIPRDQVVENDFELGTEKSLALITGSNMSGKSTFLRTIGVNHKLALMGFPVFSEEFETCLSPLKTCLHVTDDLDQGFSTFYAEVRKIAEIVKLSQGDKPFLFLIDEIFRGTNNRERLEGSQAVIVELLKHQKSIGFITTHDLELANMENQVPRLGNWHFSDEVVEGLMSFSYKVRTGPCPTTNALNIMRNEGLPV